MNYGDVPQRYTLPHNLVSINNTCSKQSVPLGNVPYLRLFYNLNSL